MNDITNNIRKLQDEINSTCISAGRNPNDVRLIAVSKTVDAGRIKEAIDAGLDTFGENYVQEALEKLETLSTSVHWHFIGNLQKNKVKHLIRAFELIHSVGSSDLASEIDKRAMQKGYIQPVLFEINVAGEATKSGFRPEKFFDALRLLKSLKHILPSGLMTMPPPVDNEVQLSGYFASLREIRDRILKQGIFGGSFRELSMGMSSDYKIAIKEGATMVRIGTAIFGPRG